MVDGKKLVACSSQSKEDFRSCPLPAGVARVSGPGVEEVGKKPTTHGP